MMKQLTQLTLTVLAVIALVASANAETYLADNFTVTGGGDANYEYTNGVRQSGTMSPIDYVDPAAGTVTNAGDHAGTCSMFDLTGLSPNQMYTNSAGNLVYEFDIERFTTDWTAFAFGKDFLQDWHHIRSGMGIAFVAVNSYEIKDRFVQTYGGISTEMGLDNAYNVKIVISQDGFPASGDAYVAIFINNVPLIMDDATKNYVYRHAAGFTNNYISIRGPLDFDNLSIRDTLASKVMSSAWNNDADSGISSSKIYTHTVNFATDATTTVNGVEFIGSGTTLPQSGPNWVYNNASPGLGAYAISLVGETPNVTGAGEGLVTDCLLDAGPGFTSGELTLSGLTSGQEYMLSLYGIGLIFMSDNSRSNYFATSDGGTITMIDQKEFGADNGQILNYTYTAPANGVFSIAAVPAVTNAGGVYCWYAFSNTVVPEPAILALLGLLGLAFFRRK
jgi:hypothetical protein